MDLATTRPYYQIAVSEAKTNLEKIKTAMAKKDWTKFGQIIEDECYRLHLLCMSSHPNILYWQSGTIAIFNKLLELREQGIEAFFTVDAGPHVHIVCKGKDVDTVKQEIEKIDHVKSIVKSGIGDQAQIIEEHLF